MGTNHLRKNVVRILLFLLLISISCWIHNNQVDAASKRYVKNLKLSKSKITVTKGKKQNLTYKVSVVKGASKKVTLKVSNKKILSVKVSGKKIIISGKKAGRATVTVTTVGKNKKGKKIKKKVKVTVTAPTVKKKTETTSVKTVTEPTTEPETDPATESTTEASETLTLSELSYQAHVEDYAWMDKVHDGEIAGTTSQKKRFEAIKINLTDNNGNSMIKYRAYVEDQGWQGWKTSGETAGSEHMGKRMEAIEIKLDNKIADQYDVYYSVHLAHFGWLGWAKNGEEAGSEHLSLRMEAIKIRIVKKSVSFSVGGAHLVEKPNISYKAHVAEVGWQDPVKDGEVAGTTHESKRVEAIIINLRNQDGTGAVEYRAYCSDIGWQDWKQTGEVAGTTHESRQMEAFAIKLKGSLANDFDIYYRAHVAEIGWMGWACNGETAGTSGGKRQLEAIEIRFVYKGADFDKGGEAYQKLTMQPTNPTEKVLNINWNHLNAIGKQAPGSESCSVFALAYCRTILDGTPRGWAQYNQHGNTQYTVYAMWGWGGYTPIFTANAGQVYRDIVTNINANKPVIVKAQGRCTPHFIAVVGYTNVTDLNNLSPNNFIIIDSGHLNGRSLEFENMGACPFSLLLVDGCYQYIVSSN